MNVISLLLATTVGSVLGVFLATGINSVLIQVSINAFFNVYFGVLFFGIGVMLLFRISSKNKIQNQASPSYSQL